jgi:ABC-type multidrug transport system fused ATPase/permease subunit
MSVGYLYSTRLTDAIILARTMYLDAPRFRRITHLLRTDIRCLTLPISTGHYMRKLLKLAFLSHPTLAATTVGVSVLVAVTEGAGLALILPIIEGLGEQELVQPEHPFSEMAFRMLTPLGIPFSTTALVLVGLALFSLQSLLLFVKTATTIKVRVAVEVSIRTKLFGALMAAPVSYFDDQHLGRFSNAITAEATRAGTAVLQLLTALVAIMLIAVYMGTAIIISWQLSFVAMGFVGAFALVARRTGSLKQRGERIIASFRSIYEIAVVVVIASLLAIGVLLLDVQTAAVVAFFVLLFRLSPRLILLQSSLYQYVSGPLGTKSWNGSTRRRRRIRRQNKPTPSLRG